MKRLSLLLVAALVLAACGTSTSTNGNTAAAQAQVRSAYVKFFASSTSVSDKVALLQNGQKFKAVVQSFASNPLAKNVSAKVSSVRLQAGNTAKVVYSVSVAGSSLGKETGTAVLENGQWKLGDASLCKLIALGGTTPSVCKS